MAKTGFESVDDYLRNQPASMKARLAKVRGAIKKALPGADEVISYQIPAYKLGGRNVIFFAGWTEHYSVYPIGELVASTLAKELSKYELSKGTIRFPLTEPVPVRLIGRIAKLRAQETLERTLKKTKKTKKTKTKKKAR